jgi:hypothetical protein
MGQSRVGAVAWCPAARDSRHAGLAGDAVTLLPGGSVVTICRGPFA